MSEPIIRDFAYPLIDPRYQGIHTIQVESEPEPEPEDPTHEWHWSYNSSPSRLPPLDEKLLTTTIIPTIDTLLSTSCQERVAVRRGIAVFPFIKATDYEMSLDVNDILLLVTPSSEKWSSIDDLVSEFRIVFEPPVEVFCREVDQFLASGKRYGDGWITALKICIGGRDGEAKVEMVDLGLVPCNYVQ